MTDKHDKLVEMALKAAFEKGWCAAAQWAQRDDLRHDTGSIAYAGQRDAILAGKASGLRSAILADAAKDVEPVGYIHPEDIRNIASSDVEHCEIYSKPFSWEGAVYEPIYPASTLAAAQALNAELVARVEGLEKDAERYRWLRDGEIVADYPYPVMRMGGSRVDDQTIWADELDAAIDAALTKGQP